MTLRIRHIDAIARQEKCDVLYITFFANEIHQEAFLFSTHDWETLPIRMQIIEWLDNQRYSWDFCGIGDPEDEDFVYLGSIYIKVPYDKASSDYQILKNYFEHPDGSMRFYSVNFCYMPFSEAIKNGHHDEPGFWERGMQNNCSP